MIQVQAFAPPVHAPVMREQLALAAEMLRAVPNLAEAFYWNANTHPDLIAYEQSQINDLEDRLPRSVVTVCNRESKERVLRMAACLKSLGAKRGDAIGILSFERPEWTEAEMAIHTIGACVVAAYVRDNAERLHYILCDAGCKFIFVENQEQLDKVLHLLQWNEFQPSQSREKKLQLKGVVSFERLMLAKSQRARFSRVTSWRVGLNRLMQYWPTSRIQNPPILTWQEALEQYPILPEKSFEYLHTRREDRACLFYTSGSTGWPKGVVATHGEVLENLRQIVVSGLLDPAHWLRSADPHAQPSITCLLPERAHVYPARVAQLAATTPLRRRYSAIVDRNRSQITPEYRASIRRDLREGGTGIVLAVPKMLIAIQQRVRQQLEESGRWGWLLSRTIENVARESIAEAEGRYTPWNHMLQRVLSPLHKRIVDRIRSQIVGPQFEFFISGGAKLPLETAAYLWAIGLPVYEGYGSTETNCPIAVNTPNAFRLGSVGKLFEGVEARLEQPTNELWVRSSNIAHRYWNLPAETAAAWTTEGWYRTGDVARIDEDGYLYIQDRIDHLLVLQNGEKVWAVEVENRFAACPYVESVLVVGHGRPALIALVAPNEKAIRHWAEQANIQLTDDWTHDPAVLTLLKNAVQDQVNHRANHVYEHVRHLGIIPSPGTDAETLTATEKIKRSRLEQLYAELIAQLYADRDHWLPIKS